MCRMVIILTQDRPEVFGDTPPPSVNVPGTRCHAWALSSPPLFALRRGVKQYPGPHGRNAQP